MSRASSWRSLHAATADPEAQVAIAVDTTSFRDLYGPQAADRFGLVLLPDCVLTPDEGECADDSGTQTMSAQADAAGPEQLRSTVEKVPAKEAPTDAEAPKNATTHTIVTGSVPVAELLDGTAGSPTTASGASARTASARTDVVQAADSMRLPGHRRHGHRRIGRR